MPCHLGLPCYCLKVFSGLLYTMIASKLTNQCTIFTIEINNLLPYDGTRGYFKKNPMNSHDLPIVMRINSHINPISKNPDLRSGFIPIKIYKNDGSSSIFTNPPGSTHCRPNLKVGIAHVFPGRGGLLLQSWHRVDQDLANMARCKMAMVI